MSAMLAGFLALVIAAAPQPAAGDPTWDAKETKDILNRCKGATDDQLADAAGVAYRLSRSANESTEAYSKRIVHKRVPDHPNVKKGQWINAVTRQLYADLAKRCDVLARFSLDKQEGRFFEGCARDAKAAADAVAKTIEIGVEGAPGFMAPLAYCDGADEPEIYGAQATVKSTGAITIENIDRVHFVNDQPPESATRTANGALKEVFSSFKQYNVSAQMIGHYEGVWRKNKGNVRAWIPGEAPAIYLNEMVLAASEAEMHTLRLMCMTKKAELRELKIPLIAPKPVKAAKKKPKKGAALESEKQTAFVKCPSDVSMQKCVDHLVKARSNGPVVYRLE
jgi:hypothetical protein